MAQPPHAEEAPGNHQPPAPSGSSGPSGPSGPEAVRPLRRDAERNRQRILKAASEVFTERGLGVTLDEIARHAGVGVGTVYRRFATKEELVEALFMQRINQFAAIAERSARNPDPWGALASCIEGWAEMISRDLGLRQMLMFATYGEDRLSYARHRNSPIVARVVERAQAAGQVRSDLSGSDVLFIVFMLAEAAEFARLTSPEIWRRYLTLILDGMRPARETTTPLPVPALQPGEMEATIRSKSHRLQTRP